MRTILRLIVVFGMCLGTAAILSKAVWGFYWHPPSIRLSSQLHPSRLSWFEGTRARQADAQWSELPGGKNQRIITELKRCMSDEAAMADCTFARILRNNGGDQAWLAVPVLASSDREAHWRLAQRCLDAVEIPKEAVLFGIVGTMDRTQGGQAMLFAAETNKLGDGKYHHLECVLDGDKFLSNSYKYEVAGLEFLTTFRIAGLLAAGSLVGAGVILGVYRLSRRPRNASRAAGNVPRGG